MMIKQMSDSQVQRGLNLLASMPFAIGILLLLSSVSAVGTLISQNCGSDFCRLTYGDIWQQIIMAASFDNVYQAWWFTGVLVCLFLSLLVALWRHSARILHITKALREIPSPPTRLSEETVIYRAEQIDHDDLLAIMKSSGFAHHLSSSENKRETLFFQKGQWGKLSFLPSHVGILIIISGGFVTSKWGFRGIMNIPDGETSNQVYIPQGEVFRIIELPFHIRNNGFQLDHYLNGMASDYRSKLEVVKENSVLSSKEISVNDPLSIGDITLYQASFGAAGSAVNISITDLSRREFNVQQLNTAVHWVLEDQELGARFTIAELREHNVTNLSTEPLKTLKRDLGPSVDIHLQLLITDTITYRVYKNFPNIIAFTRLGDEGLTTFNLGISPSDNKLLKFLSSYFLYTEYRREA